MSQERLRQLARELINKEKWWDILSRFIDVLHMNVFIVDHQGFIILPPEEGRYGGRLLVDRSLGFDLFSNASGFFNQFQAQGQFLESVNRFDLHNFAIPIHIEKDKIIAYVIVGPVIINKRHDDSEYNRLAKECGVKEQELLSEIKDIRVVSNVMLNSILELLAEIVKDNIELSIKEKELNQLKTDSQRSGQLNGEIAEVANEIYSTVRLDEILVTLLDVALKMSNTECGSIMVIDEEKGELSIKVSKGLSEKAQDARLRIGEGIAGLAAKDNTYFTIKGKQGDNRIKHLLKRDEIKHSLVMPLIAKNRVFGVLNLHTKNEEDTIEGSLDNLKHLSKLVSSAFYGVVFSNLAQLMHFKI